MTISIPLVTVLSDRYWMTHSNCAGYAVLARLIADRLDGAWKTPPRDRTHHDKRSYSVVTLPCDLGWIGLLRKQKYEAPGLRECPD